MQKNKAGMGQKMILLKINKLKTLFFPVSPVDPLAIIGEDSTKRAKKQKQNKKQNKKNSWLGWQSRLFYCNNTK